MSLRLRVTVLTCAVVALVVVVIATVFFVIVGARLRNDLDQRVTRRAEIMENAFTRLPPAALLAPIRRSTVSGPASSFSIGHAVQGGPDQDMTDDAPPGLRISANTWAQARPSSVRIITL